MPPRRALVFSTVAVGVWLLVVASGVLVGQLTTTGDVNVEAFVTTWDGFWYITIIGQGYTASTVGQSNVAFFPGLPMVVGAIHHLGVPLVVATLMVNVVALTVAMWALWGLVADRWGERAARWAVVFTLANPFSFYFAMLYAEALLLMCTCLALWCVQRRAWLPAAVCAAGAAATRVPGLVVVAIVAAAFWWAAREGSPARRWTGSVGLTLVGIAPVVAHMVFLWHRSGDPLAFASAQRFWRTSSLASELRRLGSGLTSDPLDPTVLIVLLWWASAVLLLGVTGYWASRGRRELAALAATPVVLGLGASSAVSMNRYAIVVVSLPIALATLGNPDARWRIPVAVLSAAGLVGACIALMRPVHPFLG